MTKASNKLILVLVVLLVWNYPVIVIAQGLANNSVESVPDILMLLLKTAFSILSVLVSVLLVRVISYFEKKTKIDIPAATEKMLFDLADQAIGLAYEKAHQLLEKEGKILGGSEKLNAALQFVMNIATKHNLEGIEEEKIKDYINAKLGTKRMNNNIDTTVVVAK